MRTKTLVILLLITTATCSKKTEYPPPKPMLTTAPEQPAAPSLSPSPSPLTPNLDPDLDENQPILSTPLPYNTTKPWVDTYPGLGCLTILMARAREPDRGWIQITDRPYPIRYRADITTSPCEEFACADVNVSKHDLLGCVSRSFYEKLQEQKQNPTAQNQP